VHIGLSLLTLVPGRMGGSESYVTALLDQFARGNGPERVTVLANDQVAAVYRDRGRGPVTLHRVRAYKPRRRRLAHAAGMLAAHAFPSRVAREVPPGLELLHFPVTVPIPRTGLPEIVTLHDVQHHDLPEFFSPPERALRRLTYDGAARRASAVVTPSEYSARRIVDVLGIAGDRVEVIRNGIDHKRFRPEPDAADACMRSRLGLERPFMLYPANLWPHKNHERLVKAFARVPERDLELVLTGRTYGRLEPLTELARRCGVGDRVRHLGYVDPGQVPALYRAARALVFPSLYEGFGGPPLEAMACGCPVAASGRASLAEVCGDASVVLEPESVDSIADAIERVSRDEGVRTRLRAAGLEQASRFSWKEAAARHAALYGRLARAPGSPADRLV
jgi:glycosyltransferase involved in cell wall biosynthesis